MAIKQENGKPTAVNGETKSVSQPAAVKTVNDVKQTDVSPIKASPEKAKPTGRPKKSSTAPKKGKESRQARVTRQSPLNSTSPKSKNQSSPRTKPNLSNLLSTLDRSGSPLNQFALVNFASADLVKAKKSAPQPEATRFSSIAPTQPVPSTSAVTALGGKEKKKKRKSSKLSRVESGDDTDDGEPRLSKRVRLQYQPFQSPEVMGLMPQFCRVTSSLANRNVNPDEKIVVFSKGDFLAVRNESATFYVCRTAQNVYKSRKKFKIQWLSDDKDANVYVPDFYDQTDFECVLTNLRLTKLSKGKYKLPADERQRTMNILQRALNVERGVTDVPDPRQVAADGVDVSFIGRAEEEELVKAVENSPKLKISTSTAKPLGRPKKIREPEVEKEEKKGPKKSKKDLHSKKTVSTPKREVTRSAKKKVAIPAKVSKKARRSSDTSDSSVGSRRPKRASVLGKPGQPATKSKIVPKKTSTRPGLTTTINKLRIQARNASKGKPVPPPEKPKKLTRANAMLKAKKEKKEVLSTSPKTTPPAKKNLKGDKQKENKKIASSSKPKPKVIPVKDLKPNRSPLPSSPKSERFKRTITRPALNFKVAERTIVLAESTPGKTDVLTVTVENEADATAVDEVTGNTALHFVAQYAHHERAVEYFEQLLKHGADINAVNKDGRSALHLAVNSRLLIEGINVNYDFESLLIEKGARLDLKDKDGRIPLHYAFDKLNSLETINLDLVELVSLLTSSNASSTVDIVDNTGQNALHKAAVAGATFSTILLARRVSEVDATDNSGNTAFGLSVVHGHSSCALLLFQQGAKFTSAVNNSTVLEEVIRKEMHGLLYLIVDQLKRQDQNIAISVERAIGAHSYKLAAKLINSAKLESQLKLESHNLIHILCQSETSDEAQRHILSLLIKKGLDYKAIDSYRSTPTIYAAINRNHVLCEELTKLIGIEELVKGDEDSLSRSIFAAIFWKLGKSEDLSEEIKNWASSLLNAGAEINCLCNYPVVEIGADLSEAATPRKYSPLIYAVIKGNLNVVKYLLKHKADINFCDDLGRSPLIHAARQVSVYCRLF